MSKHRVSWKDYFMNIAREVATRSTCVRKHVGAVIVREKTILSTGYNGSIKGLPHCDEVGCEMVDGHCVRTTHAGFCCTFRLSISSVITTNSHSLNKKWQTWKHALTKKNQMSPAS